MMMFRRIFLHLVTVLLLVGCTSASADSRITLADNGASDYRIVLESGADPALRHAGDELAKYLSQVTGATFPVATGGAQTSGPAIRLRVQRHMADAGANANPEAFAIRVDGKDLVIAGNSPRATLYGVYEVLENKVGVHWFDAGAAAVPTRRNLQITISDRHYAPRFGYREVFFRHADDPGFAAHNRLNGRFGHRLDKRMSQAQGGDRAIRQLSIYDLVPRQKYASSHPEFYAGGQLRFADPAVRAAAKKQLRQAVASWDKQPDYLLIAHADRDTYYHGGADGELIDRQGAPSAAFIGFVRELAQTLAATHPDVTVLAQAYLWSRQPPQAEPLPANMGVMLSGIERDFSKPLTATANRGFLDDLDGWAKLTSHIVVWDYVTDFAGYIQPYPNLHTLGPNMQALAARDAVEGVFSQGAYGTRGAAFARLRTWVLARLLWNPQRDADALIRRFVKGYYGPAAPYIQDYIAALQAAAGRWSGKLGDKTPPDAGYLDAQFLRRADRLFERAENAVRGEPAYRQHVQTARIPVDYAVLSNRDRLDGADWVAPETRLERLRQYLEQAHVTAYREGGGADIDSLLQALAIERGDTQVPAVCEGLPQSDCIVVEDDGLHLAGGGAKLVPDAAAADGGAVAMPGDTETWGIQLPLSELLPDRGRWRIYVQGRSEPAGGGDAAGLLVGVYPGDHRTVARAHVAGAAYHSLQVPGTFDGGQDGYLWVAPPNAAAVNRILIDRVVAVPAEGG